MPCQHCPSCQSRLSATRTGRLLGVLDRQADDSLQKGLSKPQQTAQHFDQFRDPQTGVVVPSAEFIAALSGHNKGLDHPQAKIDEQMAANRAAFTALTPEQKDELVRYSQYTRLSKLQQEKQFQPTPSLPLPGINVRAGTRHPVTGFKLAPVTADMAPATREEMASQLRPFLDRIERFEQPTDAVEAALGHNVGTGDENQAFAQNYYQSRLHGLIGNYLDTNQATENARSGPGALEERLGPIDPADPTKRIRRPLNNPSDVTQIPLHHFVAAMYGKIPDAKGMAKLRAYAENAAKDPSLRDGGWGKRALADLDSVPVGPDGNPDPAAFLLPDGSPIGQGPGLHGMFSAQKGMQIHQGLSTFQHNYGNDIDQFFGNFDKQGDLAYALEGLPGFSRKLSTLAAYNYGRAISQHPRPGTNDAERGQRWRFSGDTPHDKHWFKFVPRFGGIQYGTGHDNSLLAHRELGNYINDLVDGKYGEPEAQRLLGPHLERLRQRGTWESGKTAQGTYASRTDCHMGSPNCGACDERGHCWANAYGIGRELPAKEYGFPDNENDYKGIAAARLGSMIAGRVPAPGSSNDVAQAQQKRLVLGQHAQERGWQTTTGSGKKKTTRPMTEQDIIPLEEKTQKSMLPSPLAEVLRKAKPFQGQGSLFPSEPSPNTDPTNPSPETSASGAPKLAKPPNPKVGNLPEPLNLKPIAPPAGPPHSAFSAKAEKLSAPAPFQPSGGVQKVVAKPPLPPPGGDVPAVHQAGETPPPPLPSQRLRAALGNQSPLPVQGGDAFGQHAGIAPKPQPAPQQNPAQLIFGQAKQNYGQMPPAAAPVAGQTPAAPSGPSPIQVGGGERGANVLRGLVGQPQPTPKPQNAAGLVFGAGLKNYGQANQTGSQGPTTHIPPPRQGQTSPKAGLLGRIKAALGGGRQWQGDSAAGEDGVTRLNSWQTDALRNNGIQQQPLSFGDRLRTMNKPAGQSGYGPKIDALHPMQRPKDPDARPELSENLKGVLSNFELQRRPKSGGQQLLDRFHAAYKGYAPNHYGNDEYRFKPRDQQAQVDAEPVAQTRDTAGNFQAMAPKFSAKAPVQMDRTQSGNPTRLGRTRLPYGYTQFNKKNL